MEMVRSVAVMLLVGVWAGSAYAAGPGVYSVRDYGAIGDGTANDTAAINKAVSAAAAAGGGTVYVAPGRYRTGTIQLRDNITLHIERGATILGSTDYRDYPLIPPPIATDRLEYSRYALIAAVKAKNVSIVGGGTVNGQGYDDAFSKDKSKLASTTKPAGYNPYLDRPFGLSFIQCQAVTVRDIRIEEAAFWCQDYLDCDDVLIDGVTVESPKHGTNNDGIDVDGSRRVTISNCRINAGDDGICLKASYRDCENITITNCVVASTANGIKFGTASNGGFKGIAISNCAIYNTSNAGLAMESVDGGTIDGVVCSNIVMSGVGTPVFIRLGDMGRMYTKGMERPAPGAARNISISNIVARTGKEGDWRSWFCSSITGLPGHPVENVRLSNISFERLADAEKGPKPKTLPVNLDITEAANKYPEYTMFGEVMPSNGFYARHVRGLTIENVEVRVGYTDGRPTLVLDDVSGVRVRDLHAVGGGGRGPMILGREVTESRIECEPDQLRILDRPASTQPVAFDR